MKHFGEDSTKPSGIKNERMPQDGMIVRLTSGIPHRLRSKIDRLLENAPLTPVFIPPTKKVRR